MSEIFQTFFYYYQVLCLLVNTMLAYNSLCVKLNFFSQVYCKFIFIFANNQLIIKQKKYIFRYGMFFPFLHDKPNGTKCLMVNNIFNCKQQTWFIFNRVNLIKPPAKYFNRLKIYRTTRIISVLIMGLINYGILFN